MQLKRCQGVPLSTVSRFLLAFAYASVFCPLASSRNPISAAQILFYKQPDLGAEFLRRFHADTEFAILRSNQQPLDWLSAGRYGFGIGACNVDDTIMQGLPLNQFLPASLKEGSSVTAYNGTLSSFNRAPHPNAAKVAINWLLSREGQTAWLDTNQKTGGL